MIRVSLSAIAIASITFVASTANADIETGKVCNADTTRPIMRAASFSIPTALKDLPSSKAIKVSDLSDEEFARRQREFEARFPSAPSLNDTSTASAAPQYEQRSLTNIFPYSEDATGLSVNGKLALYHVGVGVVGADLVTHPDSVGSDGSIKGTLQRNALS